MKNRLRFYSSALLLATVPLVPITTLAAPAKGKAGAAAAPSAPVTAAGWGFTAKLPKSTEGFASFYRIGEMIDGFKNSGFLKKLLGNPVLVKELKLDDLEIIWKNNEEAQEVVAILRGLVEKEAVFVMSEGFTENTVKLLKLLAPVPAGMAAAARFNQQDKNVQMSAWGGVTEEYQKKENQALLIKGLADADLPPFLVAFKAGDIRGKLDGLLRDALDSLPPDAKELLESGTFQLEGGNDFQTLTFKVEKLLPPEQLDDAKAKASEILGSDADGAAAVEKIRAKTIQLSWGWVDDTLVVALGKDHSHVKLAGPEGGVLALPELAGRVAGWKAKKPLSLSYGSQKTNQAIVDALKSLRGALFTAAQSSAGPSPVPVEALLKDIQKLSARAAELWPDKVTASVTASWWDGGLRVESFGGLVVEAYDSSKPLKYSGLAGPATVFLSESRVNEASRDKAFNFIEEATATLWSTFQATVKPALSEDVRQSLDAAEAFRPAILEVWKAVQSLRGALGNESAFLVNLDGAMPSLPNVPAELKSLKIPRILAVSDLKDPAKLSEAWSGFSTVINGLVSLSGTAEVPEPVEKKKGAVTMWGLPLPMDTGDLWPHAAVAGTRWYLSTSPSFTAEAAAKTAAPAGPPSGAHVKVNFKTVWTWLGSTVGFMPNLPEQKQNMRDVLELLGALEQIDARTGNENGDTHVELFIGIKDLK